MLNMSFRQKHFKNRYGPQFIKNSFTTNNIFVYFKNPVIKFQVCVYMYIFFFFSPRGIVKGGLKMDGSHLLFPLGLSH